MQREIIGRHGCCNKLIIDRGTNFTSVLFSKVYKLMQVEKFHVAAFHAQGNGMKESERTSHAFAHDNCKGSS